MISLHSEIRSLSWSLFCFFFRCCYYFTSRFFLSQVCYASFSHLTALHENNAFVAMQLLVSRRDVIFVLLFFLLMNVLCLLRHERSDFFFQEKHFFSLLFCVRSYNFVWLFFCFRNLIFFLFSSQHHPIVFQIPKKEQNRCFFLNSHFFSSRINDAALKLLLMFDVVAMRL